MTTALTQRVPIEKYRPLSTVPSLALRFIGFLAANGLHSSPKCLVYLRVLYGTSLFSLTHIHNREDLHIPSICVGPRLILAKQQSVLAATFAPSLLRLHESWASLQERCMPWHLY